MQVARERLEEDEGALVAQSVQRADEAKAHVEQTRARLVHFGARARHALAVSTPRETHVALQRLLVLCPVPQCNTIELLERSHKRSIRINFECVEHEERPLEQMHRNRAAGAHEPSVNVVCSNRRCSSAAVNSTTLTYVSWKQVHMWVSTYNVYNLVLKVRVEL